MDMGMKVPSGLNSTRDKVRRSKKRVQLDRDEGSMISAEVMWNRVIAPVGFAWQRADGGV